MQSMRSVSAAMTGEGGKHERQPTDAAAFYRQARHRHSAPISRLGAIRRRRRTRGRGERARARLPPFRSARARARRSSAGDDCPARRPFGFGAPGAGGSFMPHQRSAAHLDPRAGRRRTGSGRSGASALARADRRRPRRLRQDRRRGRSDGACPQAKPAARRSRRAGRDRPTRRGSRAHRQSRDRSSGGIARSAS